MNKKNIRKEFNVYFDILNKYMLMFSKNKIVSDKEIKALQTELRGFLYQLSKKYKEESLWKIMKSMAEDDNVLHVSTITLYQNNELYVKVDMMEDDWIRISYTTEVDEEIDIEPKIKEPY